MNETSTPANRERSEPVDVATAQPRRRPGRIVISVVIVAVLARIAWFLITNDRFEWNVVGDYLFNRNVLKGLGVSVMLTAIGMTLGSLLGVFLAAGQLHDFAPVRWVCQLYVGVFRGIPPLVQLIFWYNLAFLVPTVGIGVPGGPELVTWSSNDLITPLTAAVIGLSLHEAAYMAEIFRSGIISVEHGQRDAAAALGFSGRQTFWRVVLPQSMRIILPPTGSQFISLLKGTSLVSVIAMNDLLRSVQLIYNRTYDVVPMLMVAVIWYLVVVTFLTIVQRRIEARFGRGYDRTAGQTAPPSTQLELELST